MLSTSFVRPCAQCGADIIAPEWSEYLSNGCVRNIWTCEACGYGFEDSVYFSASQGHSSALTQHRRPYHRLSLAAGGILAMAWCVIGAAPYVATAGLTNSAPQFAVDQFRKGDRLPMTRTPAVWHDLLTPQSLQSGKKLPVGCDPVFGPIASPAAKSVYGRCIV